MKSKIIKQTRKILALLLCAALVRGAVNWTTVPAEAADTTGLCEHHTEHDADCGYVEALEGQLCTHDHNEDCGYVEAGVVTPCTHDHNEDCGYIAPTEEAPCTHEHDGTCGYTEGTAAIPCDQNCTNEDGDGSIDHAAGCAYSPAVAGTPCSHNHNDDCGYAAASAGAPCTHIHDENCGYAAPTEGVNCSHEHDESCGYVEAVAGQPCQYDCEICDTDADAEQDEDTNEEIMLLEGDIMPFALEGNAGNEVIAQFNFDSDSNRLADTSGGNVEAKLISKDGQEISDLSKNFKDGALYIDNDAYLSLPGRLLIGVDKRTVGMTVEMRVKTDGKLNTNWPFFAAPNANAPDAPDAGGTNREHYLGVLLLKNTTDNKIIAERYANSGSRPTNPSLDWTDNEWHTIKVDFSENSTILYVDGTHVSEVASDYSLAECLGASGVLWFGQAAWNDKNNTTTKEGFSGYIDDIKISIATDSTGLTEDEFIIKNDAENKVEDPAHTKINLFDYWITGQTDNDYRPNLSKTQVLQGINKDHLFIFSGDDVAAKYASENDEFNNVGGTFYSGAYVGSWNAYSGPGAGPISGIVKNRLPADGYPELNDLTQETIGNATLNALKTDTTKRNESLQYLFEPSDGDDGEYKRAYSDVSGLFRLVNGYYVFDSHETFAELNIEQTSAPKQSTGDNHITLYNKTWGSEQATNGEFFPFNDWSDLFYYDSSGQLSQRFNTFGNQNATDEKMNHYFGMTIETTFIQPINGQVVNPDTQETEDMIFEFTGDDDVWIFIDGVLVGDLGGIHGASKFDINFATGVVNWGTGQTNHGTSTLKDLFPADEQTTWENNTFAANTPHTLKFFYLERGNNVSNCSLRLNLGLETVPITITPEATKSLNGEAPSEGQFTFYLYDGDPNADGKLIDTKTNAADGKVVFDGRTFKNTDFSQTFTYYITEKNDRKPGVRYDSSIYRMTISFEPPQNTVDDWTPKIVYERSVDGGQSWNPLNEGGTPTFTNTMVPPEQITLAANKTLSGADLAADQFTFGVYTDKECKTPLQVDNVAVTAKNDAKGNVSFDVPVTIDDIVDTNGRINTLYYYLKEVDGRQKGITYDTSVYQATVIFSFTETDGWSHKVTYALLNANGTVKETLQGSDLPAFTNTIKPVTVTPEVTKIVTNGKPANGQFTFELYTQDDNNTRLLQEKTNATNGRVLFDDLVFKNDDFTKTFTYYIKEINGGQSNIQYDSSIYKMEISFTGSLTDGWTSNVKYWKATDAGATTLWEALEWTEYKDKPLPTFTNIIDDPPIYVTPEVTKVLTGGTLAENIFTFGLYEQDPRNNDANQIGNLAQNDADGKVSFENIMFDEKTNWAGTFTYYIKEINDGKNDIIYDSHICRMTITFPYAASKKDYTPNIVYEYWDDEANDWLPYTDNLPTFTNKKIVNVDVHITWEKEDDPKIPDEVVVELVDENGIVVGEEHLNKDNDWSCNWPNLDADKKWTVREQDKPDGFTYSEDEPFFDEDKNSWHFEFRHKRGIDVDAHITWGDPKDENIPDNVIVELVGEDGDVVNEQILSEENDWSYTWEGLDPDKEWSVREKKKPDGFTYDDDDWTWGKDGQNKHFEFYHERDDETTEENITVDAHITWEDPDDPNIPKEVVVQLVKNGEVVEEQTLSEENGWRHTWTDLDPNAEWSVQEKKEPDGFTYEDAKWTWGKNGKNLHFEFFHDRKEESPAPPNAPSNPTPKPKIDVDVRIEWKDDGTKRPDKVEVELVDENGNVVDSATLSESNNWSHTFKELDPNIKWTVREKNRPGGFTYVEDHNGYHFVFVHDRKLIQTGQLKWPIPFLAGFGIVFIGLGCAMKVSQRKRVMKNKQTQ